MTPGMERPEPVWVGTCPICGYQDIHAGDPEDAGAWCPRCPRWSMHGQQPPPRLEPAEWVPASYADHLEQRVRELEDAIRDYERATVAWINAPAGAMLSLRREKRNLSRNTLFANSRSSRASESSPRS